MTCEHPAEALKSITRSVRPLSGRDDRLNVWLTTSSYFLILTFSVSAGAEALLVDML